MKRNVTDNSLSTVGGVLFLLLLPLLLAACQDDVVVGTATDHPVRLGATVVAPTASTRAGHQGPMDFQTLTATGFGVFASAKATTDHAAWTWKNQPVRYVLDAYDPSTEPSPPLYVYPGNWTYYADDMDIKAEQDWHDQSISFYAYAPRVPSTTSDATETSGITAVSDAPTDPIVSYAVAQKPSECVDLLWGINDVTGLPWTDATADATGGSVLFSFNHALAAIGFHLQAMVDKDNNLDDLDDAHDATGMLGTDCKVTIERITLTPSKPFYGKGRLHLAKDDGPYKPYWEATDEDRTIGQLSVAGEDIDAALLDPGDMSPDDMTTQGVTGVIATANSQTAIRRQPTDGEALQPELFFLLIPETGQVKYTVKIEYYVTYKNPAETNGYTRLDYTGKKAGVATIENLSLRPCTKYYLNFVIGLRTQTVSVTATDWQDNPVDIAVTVDHGTSANSSLAPVR